VAYQPPFFVRRWSAYQSVFFVVAVRYLAGRFSLNGRPMNFTHYNLGHVDGGSIVEVTLQGSAANVRLMDSSNFSSYQAGRQHRYHGGLAKSSPVRLQVPSSGTWHVAVDMQGLRGTARSGIRVIPSAALRPLPTINEASLRSMPTLVRNAGHDLPPSGAKLPPSGAEALDGRTWDVFISHA
jgi:hypothetical protein